LQAERDPQGIVALDITFASNPESPDPTGRLATARQFADSVVKHVEQKASSLGDNVQVVDFSRRNDPRTRRE
jgi:hypothetical protein